MADWCRASDSGPRCGAWRIATACAERSPTTVRASPSMQAERHKASMPSFKPCARKHLRWRAWTVSNANPPPRCHAMRHFASSRAAPAAYTPALCPTRPPAPIAPKKFLTHLRAATVTRSPTARIAARGCPSSGAFPMTGPAPPCSRSTCAQPAAQNTKTPPTAASTPNPLPAMSAARAPGWSAPTARPLRWTA